MKKRSKVPGMNTPVILSALIGLIFAAANWTHATIVEVFSESFETDGSVAMGDGRYVVENGSDDGANDFFARRLLGSAGTQTRGNIDGDWIWTFQDIDGDGQAVNDLEADEGRITWTKVIDISGRGNIKIISLAAQGGDEQEFDNVINFQVKFDDGDWFSVGGFRGLHTQSPSVYFQGDLRTIPPFNNPRLTQSFKEFSWDVFGRGETMRIRLFVNHNGGSEEGAVDNIRIVADDSLFFLDASVRKDVFSETEGAGAGSLTLTLSNQAPAGGLLVNVTDTDTDDSEALLPSTITIPEGDSSITVPFDIVDDGRFDGDELVLVLFDAPGFSREQVSFTVTNAQVDKPNVIINEFLPKLNDVNEEDLSFDANNDGVVNDDQDQFIEILNLEDFDVDISGWTVNDELAPRHIFPTPTVLPPGGVIVVFAGGDPRGIFGGAQVQTASLLSINFDEDGDIAQLIAGGALIDSFAYGADIGEPFTSIARDPDITGNFVLHDQIAAANGALWSPGTKVDGSLFSETADTLTVTFDSETVAEDATSLSGTVSVTSPAPPGGYTVNLSADENGDELTLPDSVVIPEGATEVQFDAQPVNDGLLDGDRELPVRATGDQLFPSLAYVTVTDVANDPFDVVINEALGDILGTNSDVNGNGIVEEPVEDQFIEIVNAGTANVDLTGWTLNSWTTNEPGGPQLVHEFPSGTVLAPQGAIVLWGGDNEADLKARSDDLFGGAIIQVGNRHGNGVNVTHNGGDFGRITLFTPNGKIEDDVVIVKDVAAQGQSITRSPDITGDFGALHLAVSTALELASPGRQLDGTAFPGNGEVAAENPLGCVDLGGGFCFSDWYGIYNPKFYPWVFHIEHGWQFVFETGTVGTVFLFDLESADFWFTTSDFEPLTFFSFNRGTFNFYFVGTSNPREFVDLETNEFYNIPAN